MAPRERTFLAMVTRAGVIALLLISAGASVADDYVRDIEPSAGAYAYFSAVPENLPSIKITRGGQQKHGVSDAFFTEDGGISIPPGAMVSFNMNGHCMDPHLPAPGMGEPMQFIDVGKLVPSQLREMYDNLIERERKGDPMVLACNPQHLVWAIRTAGTDDPMSNSLSAEQIALLDDCAGSRGAFMRYHLRTRRRNARRSARSRDGRKLDQGAVSVGQLTYNAAELSGTNGARRVEEHIAQLTEMTRSISFGMPTYFRYGEVEDEVYTDIVCNGGLSFAARILNASGSSCVFRAYDFAAQVGNGCLPNSRRQRVTMEAPEEFTLIRGAAVGDVEIDWDIFADEAAGSMWMDAEAHSRHKRTVRTWEEKEGGGIFVKDTVRRRKKMDRKIVEDPQLHFESGKPKMVVRTNGITHVSGSEQGPSGTIARIAILVVDFEYNDDAHTGMLVLEVLRLGAASRQIGNEAYGEVCPIIVRDLRALVRKGARRHSPPIRLPLHAEYELDNATDVEPIVVNDKNFYEVRFREKGFEKPITQKDVQ